MLTQIQIEQFINEGFIKIERAFPALWAKEGREILWKDTGCDPNDASTWTKPVIRLGFYGQEPFRKAINTPALHAAFDQLVGAGNWIPRDSIGTFPVRFPRPEDPGDTGWHVDGSFPGLRYEDFSSWRINSVSRGRALLMLFLFSDVAEPDAPTRIRIGSHVDVARLLADAGDEGMAFLELAQKLDVSSARPEVHATGEAGTVYLCHPFLVHAAQPHKGTAPRFLAQPTLELVPGGVQLHRNGGVYSPVEVAIRKGLYL